MTKKFLLVDDNPASREALERNIRRNFRNKDMKLLIRKAENGEVAVKMAKEDPPDIILLDMWMPIMDGIQACSILRSNPLFDPTFIILLTGDATGEVKGLSTGADDYITKPFDSDALILRIVKGLEAAAKRSVVIQDRETGLWTREYFINCRIEGELGRAKRHGRPLSFILIRSSHRDGPDEQETLQETLLSDLAKTLPARNADICVRWDDQTFAILLPETDLDGAMVVAEGLRKRFLEIDGGLVVHIGISHFDLDNQVEALQAFAETSLAVARDSGEIIVNGRPVGSKEAAAPVA